MSLYTCFFPLPKDVNYFSKKGQQLRIKPIPPSIIDVLLRYSSGLLGKDEAKSCLLSVQSFLYHLLNILNWTENHRIYFQLSMCTAPSEHLEKIIPRHQSGDYLQTPS